MDGKEWRTLGRRYLHKSPWFAFRLDEVRLPGGEEIEYGVLEGNDISVVLATTQRGNVVLVRQWRQPIEGMSLSLPGGAVDAGETPMRAAERELFEETGYRAKGLKRLFSIHASPGRSDELVHIFACRAVPDWRGPRPEPTEYIEVVEMIPEEAWEQVRAGSVTDAASVIGLQWLCMGEQ